MTITKVFDDLTDLPLPCTVGIISDTHCFDKGGRSLPPEVIELFRRFGVGLILHCGDINVQSLLDKLAETAPVLAVQGNNEEEALQESLPWVREIHIGQWRIGQLHGHGGKSAKEVVRRTFTGKVDLAVYGHSHQPEIAEEGGTIFFNPGSPTERRYSLHCGVGILHVNTESIRPELILFTRPADLNGVNPQ